MAKVTVTNNGYSIESLYKWDTGQELEIYGMTLPVAPQVHFTHKGDQYAIVRQASMDASGVIRVSIPDIMLQSTARLCAYICIEQGDEFKTLCKITIPVISRAKPNDYAPDEEPLVYSLAAVGMEVVTLEPGAEATVEKVMDGDNLVLRFCIPAPVGGSGGGSGDSAAATDAAASAAAAKASAEAAEKAKSDAEEFKNIASRSALDAHTAENAAKDAKTAAEGAQGKAETAQANAEKAKEDAESAKTAAETAKSSAQSAYQATNGLVADAQRFANQAGNSASAADSAASSANRSKNAAATSETNAGKSATSAQSAKTAAETAKAGAENAKTAAASSATTAQNAAAQAQECLETVETKLEKGEFDGAPGQRGPGTIKVSSMPQSFTTPFTTDDGETVNPIYRMAITLIQQQSGVSDVVVGDILQVDYFQYAVSHLHNNYAIITTPRTSIQGDTGQRGTGILKVTTAPSSYTTAIGDYTPKYRIALSSVISQAKVDKVLLGDVIQYSYYQYLVDYMDATYAYTSATRTSIQGTAGKTPVKGTDYWTAADKAEMVDELTEEAAPVSYNAQNLTPAQQAQARSNIGAFGQNSLTLGVHTDGLIYLFVDGAPVGNGIEQGVSGDVVGYVDENNNIVLTGELPEGAVYNVKYEMEDGSTVNIGELSLVQAVEIINQIPISTDASGNLFVGTNGEKGYKTGFRISGSSGNESAQTGTEVTGFIPYKYGNDVYIKNITDDGSHVVGFYTATHSLVMTTAISNLFGGAINGEIVKMDKTILGNKTAEERATIAFMRVSATEITADSIITVNQPIE